MPDAARLALGTFTVLRVPAPRHLDSRVAGQAMLLAPLTALPLVLVWAVLAAAATRGWLPALVAGALTIAASALLSRAMHLDGLADTADGLSASYDRERALEVMRRSDTGPSGAVALVLVLLLQAASLAALSTSAAGALLGVVAVLASRLAPAIACRRGVPAARPQGLGQTVAGTVGPIGLALAAGVLTATGASSAVVFLESPWYAAVLVVAAGALAAWSVTRRAVRRLGGITGDTIGAAVEISLAASLVVASAIYSVLV
jgi:adenosylcobinamide-GDP ribazoletransferase